MSLEELKTNLETFGQQHLLQFWNDLNSHEKDSFESELKEIDFENLQHALNQTRVEKLQNKQNENLKPIPSELKSGIDASSHEQLERYESKGLKAIQDGQVAVLLLAGGQGTRMGVNYPKGMYSVKLPSNKSLFQLQAERLIRVQELAGVKSSSSIHWYIMTSDNTKNAIESYFKTNDYFKLNSNNIHFFEQGTMPCFSKDGKVLLDQKNKISRSPDGNGGLYKALVKYDILDDLIRRGVKYIHVYCVDNILVRIADPVFIGYCIERNADCAAKVVKKVDPKENVGVICLSEEKFKVVEYSEISEENRNLRDVNNDLVFNAGNICNHFFTLDFLVQACNDFEKKLKYHIAEKKINFIDENGMYKKPVTANGIKLEKFIFDIFEFAKKFAVWEVARKDEFSPLKNGLTDTTDNELSCRRDVLEQHYKWLLKAGVKFIESQSDETDDDEFNAEISPLVSYSGEGLNDLKEKQLKMPVILEKSSDSITFNGLDYSTYII